MTHRYGRPGTAGVPHWDATAADRHARVSGAATPSSPKQTPAVRGGARYMSSAARSAAQHSGNQVRAGRLTQWLRGKRESDPLLRIKKPPANNGRGSREKPVWATVGGILVRLHAGRSVDAPGSARLEVLVVTKPPRYRPWNSRTGPDLQLALQPLQRGAPSRGGGGGGGGWQFARAA